MVEKSFKRRVEFMVFIFPALLLYAVFCIFPFLRGVGISLTNWDGLTQKAPIVLGGEDARKVFSNIKNDKDKSFVESIYEFDAGDSTYKRRNIAGFKKFRLEKILKKAGWVSPYYKNVGLDNYKKIFTGGVAKGFYPGISRVTKFTVTSSLPRTINKADFEKEILPRARENAGYEEKLLKAYEADSEGYRRKAEYDEKAIIKELLNISEVAEDGTIKAKEVRTLAKDVLSANDEAAINSVTESFKREYKLSDISTSVLEKSIKRLSDIRELKKILSECWVSEYFSMGVIGFTVFFAIFSVIGINVLAFALALALDSGVFAERSLRTVFFLPNVLSMIIVSLIWSMLFNQFLPAITGIDKWISDSVKTPWLLVLVAVWQGAGYYMIVYLAGLQSIPTSTMEAAKIDGASGFQRFRYIIFPMMIPSITVSLFLTIANALKSFDLIYSMLGPTSYATGTVPFVMDIYFDAFSKKLAGLATAKAMVLFFFIVLITGIQLFVMKRKEVEA